MLIQWFPGHMAKAKRILQEHLKIVDIVLELRDARIPESSSNPDLDKLVQNKSRVIILNKKDLANPRITREWIEHFSAKAPTFAVNTITGEGLNDVMNAVRQKAEEINERLKRRGRNPRNIRLLVIGIPNVGKSALINRIANRASTKVANRPGVTRGQQWIKVREGLQLMDSPGILWPKFEDQETGLRLAATGAIKSELLDEEHIAFQLVKWLQEIASEELKNFFNVELSENPYETILAIGRRRGLLQAGGVVRGEQTAKMILKEFRDGRIGQITLELPRKEEATEPGNASSEVDGDVSQPEEAVSHEAILHEDVSLPQEAQPTVHCSASEADAQQASGKASTDDGKDASSDVDLPENAADTSDDAVEQIIAECSEDLLKHDGSVQG